MSTTPTQASFSRSPDPVEQAITACFTLALKVSTFPNEPRWKPDDRSMSTQAFAHFVEKAMHIASSLESPAEAQDVVNALIRSLKDIRSATQTTSTVEPVADLRLTLSDLVKSLGQHASLQSSIFNTYVSAAQSSLIGPEETIADVERLVESQTPDACKTLAEDMRKELLENLKTVVEVLMDGVKVHTEVDQEAETIVTRLTFSNVALDPTLVDPATKDVVRSALAYHFASEVGMAA